MAVDLGKQIGPLPLGAWIVVVGGGLGIALWSRRNASAPVEEVEDTSGVPGVGVGAPADWTPITGTQPSQPAAPTTNEEWGRRVINWGLAMNYPATLVDSAVRKYLNSLPLSVNETAFMAVALVANGAPPQQLPPVENESPPPNNPPSTNPPPSTVVKPATPTGLHTATKGHNSITVAWKPVPGATGYQVVLASRAQYFDWVNNTTVPGGYTIRNLTPGLPVTIAVRARNSAGNSNWSAPLVDRLPIV